MVVFARNSHLSSSMSLYVAIVDKGKAVYGGRFAFTEQPSR